mgnify:CR=1 FL=1
MNETSTKAQWARDFQSALSAIPSGWVWTDPIDGWQVIDLEHVNHPLVQHYASLMQVGYAKGWH